MIHEIDKIKSADDIWFIEQVLSKPENMKYAFISSHIKENKSINGDSLYWQNEC